MHTEDQQLSGAWAVVTGSSQGIGRAISLNLAKAGANVLVHTGSREQQAREVQQEVAAFGVQSEVVVSDLATKAGVDSLLNVALQWQPDIDIWVNNAGFDVLTGTASSDSFEAKLDQLWAVDVKATIRLSRAVGQRMMQRSDPPMLPTILNMGWDQAESGMAGDAGEMFGTIKGAVMAFSRSLAKSLAPGVRVNCLAPGWIRTSWGEQASEYWQERARSESLLQRWGTPDDVARLALFLVSPQASYITGQVVAVNGGFAHGR